MKKQGLRTGAKAGAFSAALTLIVLAVAIALNLIVRAMPSSFTKIDTTSEKVFTFSGETESFVRGLTDEITVYFICTEGAEDKYLSEALDKFKSMNSKIKVQRVSYEKEPALIEQYVDESVSVTDNSLIIVSGERSKFIALGDIYYVNCAALGGKLSYDDFNYYDEYYTYYYGMSFEDCYYQYTGTELEYSVSFAGEGEILSALDFVTRENLPKIYVLGDGSELSLNSVLTEAFKSGNYQTEPLALTKTSSSLGGSDTVGIPGDADAVLLMSTASDITETELSALTEYVAGGGNLIVSTDYTSPEYENLRKLASVYGLDIESSVVQESDASYYSTYQSNIKATKSGVLENFSYDVIVSRAHAIRIAEQMPEGMKASVLLSTSESAYAKALGADTSKLEKAEGDLEGKFSLAVTVECEGQGTVSWFSSNYYLVNEASSNNSEYNNWGIYNLAYMEVIRALCPGASVATAEAVELSEGILSVTEASARLWAIITIGIIPLAFIGVGFTVWLRRRSK